MMHPYNLTISPVMDLLKLSWWVRHYDIACVWSLRWSLKSCNDCLYLHSQNKCSCYKCVTLLCNVYPQNLAENCDLWAWSTEPSMYMIYDEIIHPRIVYFVYIHTRMHMRESACARTRTHTHVCAHAHTHMLLHFYFQSHV